MFRNKKMLIPIIVAVVVIILAIVAIVILGMNEKKSKNKNASTVQFDNEQTNSSNDIDEDNDDTDEDIPEFYEKAAKQFVEAYMDDEEMEKFIEEYFDATAFVAYDKLDEDELDKFMDEYAKVDEEDAEEVVEKFKQIPEAYTQVIAFMQAMQEMSNGLNNNGNSTNNNTTMNEIDVNEITEMIDAGDLVVEFERVENLQKSEEVEEITSVDVVISIAGEENTFTMVFYEEFVIYIADEDGNSILSETNNIVPSTEEMQNDNNEVTEE